MGREVRMVPADWRHPKEYNSYRGRACFVPLYDSGFGGGYEAMASDWDEGWRKWQEGLCQSYGDGPKWKPIEEEDRSMRYTGYAGSRPSPDDYMPNWSESERTHYMMYEDTSEGTPISPAFATPEELAAWLVRNEASAFGGMTADYDSWLRVARGGFAPSAVIEGGRMTSGVAMDAQAGEARRAETTGSAREHAVSEGNAP